MKKIEFVTAVVLLGMLLGGCGGGSQLMEVSCDTFYSQASQSGTIEAKVGETFELMLCSNPTTGYQWEDPAVISNPAVLEQVSTAFVEPTVNADSQLVGAPGIQSWSFKALSAGTAQVLFTYSQPWEGGDKGAWSYTLNVTVR